MSKKNFLITTILLLAVGLLGRLIPHPWNMTPITAIALFGSARFGFKYSLMLVFAVMLITDAFIGFYDWQIMLSVYASFGMVALIGLCIKKRERAPSVILGAVSSSLLFFLVTNWAVWQFGTMYSPGLVGLAQSYVMALPFFHTFLFPSLAPPKLASSEGELEGKSSPKFRGKLRGAMGCGSLFSLLSFIIIILKLF